LGCCHRLTAATGRGFADLDLTLLEHSNVGTTRGTAAWSTPMPLGAPSRVVTDRSHQGQRRNFTEEYLGKARNDFTHQLVLMA
jgi:hypothetical protein